MNASRFPIVALDGVTSFGSGQQLVFLVAAAISLLVALRLTRRAVVPLAPLLRSLAAVAGAVVAIAGALLFVVLAALVVR